MRTPLYDRHVTMGAQMVEFSGWMMPLQYSSMREEHVAVRERVGVFDVSHMGEFVMKSPGADAELDRLVSNEITDLATGQARYNLICNDAGGIIDDCLVYRDDGGYLVVVNAGPRITDLQHFVGVAGERSPVVDETLETGLIAVQGPRAIELLQPLVDLDLASIGYYHFALGRIQGVPARLSRTGYTGEDGFEIFLPAEATGVIWDAILFAGHRVGAVPCGLGARDTLRLEASMRLSGQDISEETNPLEAGLGWAVKLDKGDFVGRDALRRIKEEGTSRTMVGLELEGRAIARHGYPILDSGRQVGEVTSGTFSFTLGKAVAMGYVETASRDSGNLAVDVRGTPVGARRVPMPFYKRPR
jgi:aminomethyltransferase